MKKFTALMLALMMSLSLVACGNKPDDSNNADDANTDNNTEQTGGTLVLGTSADYAPYEFMYADDSGTMQYAGIDISAGQYIADELGMELQVENMSFDYLLTSLAKGDFDIVMAAIEVTPERLQSADFSDPYYTDLPAMILVKADAADQYNTLADFAGKSVGAQTYSDIKASLRRYLASKKDLDLSNDDNFYDLSIPVSGEDGVTAAVVPLEGIIGAAIVEYTIVQQGRSKVKNLLGCQNYSDIFKVLGIPSADINDFIRGIL